MTENRVLALAAGAALVASAALGTASAVPAHAAALRTQRHPQTAKVTPASLPHYKIRVIGPDNDLSDTQAIVSANGEYLVNNYTDAIEYNTSNGDRIGEATTDNPVVSGVADNGTMVGTDSTYGPSHDQTVAFSWTDGTYRYFPAKAPCVSPLSLTASFDGVSPEGTAVGEEAWNCGGVVTSYAISHPDNGGDFTIIGSKGPTPAVEAYIDNGGLAVGFSAGSNDDQVSWDPLNNSNPVPVRTSSGSGNLYPEQTVNWWNSSGKFVADDTALNSLVFVNHKQFIKIPTTAFAPTALGNNNVVVGSNGDVTAELWSASTGVKTLKSVSSPTSEQLVRALTVDQFGNIYGVGAGKNSAENYFEAEVVLPAPTVKITTPKAGHTYTKGATLKASYSCKPGAGTTVKTCKGSVADHHKVSTSKVGKHSFTVTATDANGVKSKKTIHFTVKRKSK